MNIQTERGGRSKARSLHRRSKGVVRSIDTVLVEPDTLFRVGLEHILANTHFHILATMDTIAEIDSELRSKKTPSLFILRIAGETRHAIDDVTALKLRYPDSWVVCISEAYEAEAIITLLCAGVNGLMLRSVSASTFVEALKLVVAGGRVVPQELPDLTASRIQDEGVTSRPSLPGSDTSPGLHASADEGALSRFSSREQDVLQLLVNGEANKMIAIKLAISEATVKVHIRAILRKIQVKNRTQAAIWALNHNLSSEVTPPAPATPHNAGSISRANGSAGDAPKPTH